MKTIVTDQQWMDLALRLGRRCAGVTAENPAVGCVIVIDTKWGPELVGRGWTQRGGRPHAERVALAEAGDRAKGATAYVTLEPCSHYGKSPPCAKGLIEAGVKRVVCAHPDPDKRVAGRGFEMLAEAGIMVDSGLEQQRANRDLAGFLSRTKRNRPWLQVKMAVSPDGKTGVRGEGNFPITGQAAKQATYGLRMQADAILVGIETAIVDDPSLTVRLPALEDRSPLRVVLDSKARLPLESHLVKTARDVPVWIMTSKAAQQSKRDALERAGCIVLAIDPDSDGHVDLSKALHSLSARGINKVFAETGATLADALLARGLIDEFILYQGVHIVGEEGIPALDGNPVKALTRAGFTCEMTRKMGEDRMIRFVHPNSIKQIN
ncbi:bifunctional diaminohydroxyphosphoribosylaminopyrimidine deaminase/5-amino-6-(5-phosphoribosylamino)uracil reductase RibD [uncultured Cohaesibacter sp.]|uniref:bifunctional diaminohydroxyphosphoribosylaminopyrimidine deaminase/5-amino-6-(5-phosphoribosylamino)uracil reductase RibD n=1 Tax=uncultured Cohaesibacter sp. TaxID=1002546 RepID=UPI002931610C|nr:bifunctional diaminohydroxyphosphoribosylaminopyrimidine deaminase/5-amino-6-(5-phosphoribosylamino)uracil reductase RibD [uncultured Cohaesibacter sp.]